MRQMLLLFSLISFSVQSWANSACPDLTGQYVCGIQSENDVVQEGFPIDISFAYDGYPVYYISSPTNAIPYTTYIANDQVHPGITPDLKYRASCAEKKLIVKYYIGQRAIDVRIYTQSKDGFEVDTLHGDREVCRFNPHAH